MFVAEGNWLECQDGFARLLHWLDVLLVARRRSRRAELAVGIDNDRYAVGHCDAANSSDEGRDLLSFCANADLGALGSGASCANINVVASSSKASASGHSDCNVTATGRVIQ